MERVALELLLRLGFVLMIWALKDSLQKMMAGLRDYHLPPAAHCAPQRNPIATPQRLIEPMGWYLDQPIHRYAIIEGRYYRFEFVSPAAIPLRLTSRQRWIEPGIVYTEAADPAR